MELKKQNILPESEQREQRRCSFYNGLVLKCDRTLGTHAPTRTPKIRVTIAKSTRSRFDMNAAGSTCCPSIARPKEESDWRFLEAA